MRRNTLRIGAPNSIQMREIYYMVVVGLGLGFDTSSCEKNI